MADRRCAYCGSEGKMSREHLWPASLHSRLVAVNGTDKGLFWLRRINAEVQGEPTMRDVCRACNNGPLSELDNYICMLFDRYFARILQRFEKVEVEFDYHLLKRWLLKMSYNSARMHSSLDLFVYPPLLPYINGHSKAIGRSVQVYLQLAYPGVVPPERREKPEFQDAPAVWEPQDNRVGFAWFDCPGVGRKLLRAVHLRSYTFYLAFFQITEKSSVANDFAREFLLRMPGTALLMASRSRLNLECDGEDAWRSFDGARETALSSG